MQENWLVDFLFLYISMRTFLALNFGHNPLILNTLKFSCKYSLNESTTANFDPNP